MENEAFDGTVWSLVIEERKKDIKKKTKEIQKLKDKNEQTMKMVDGMKDRHEEKSRAKAIELGKATKK